MLDWTTYAIADFIPFDRQAAERLYVIANARLWPWHLLSAALAGLLLSAFLVDSRRAWRAGLIALGGAWTMVAGGVLGRELASLLWIGPQLAWASVAFAAVPIALAFSLGRDRASRRGPVAALDAHSPRPFADVSVPAGLLLLWAIVGHPSTAPLVADRPWAGVEWFGIAPAPTAMATLAAAAVLPWRTAILLTLGPLAWFLLAAAAALVLGQPDTTLSIVIAMLLFIVAVVRRATRRRAA
ncbi:MAG: hypothetical protein R3E87_04485 [Burkholderiaceae bacterium]